MKQPGHSKAGGSRGSSADTPHFIRFGLFAGFDCDADEDFSAADTVPGMLASMVSRPLSCDLRELVANSLPSSSPKPSSCLCIRLCDLSSKYGGTGVAGCGCTGGDSGGGGGKSGGADGCISSSSCWSVSRVGALIGGEKGGLRMAQELLFLDRGKRTNHD